MRLNRYIASADGISRRQADKIIAQGKVSIDNKIAQLGQQVLSGQKVSIGERILQLPEEYITIALNKPEGIVVSRDGQGSKTIYEILPDKYSNLKPIGRLDKNSSGLLLLTNDGKLAHELTHPSQKKTKVYNVTLDKTLSEKEEGDISKHGVMLEDGLSKLLLRALNRQRTAFEITMSEGRNRQIRRTFRSLGYEITKLNRIQFGEYKLEGIGKGEFKIV